MHRGSLDWPLRVGAGSVSAIRYAGGCVQRAVMTAVDTEKENAVAPADAKSPLEEAEVLLEQLSLQDAFKRFQERRKVRPSQAPTYITSPIAEASLCHRRRSGQTRQQRRRRRPASGRHRSSSSSCGSASWRKPRSTSGCRMANGEPPSPFTHTPSVQPCPNTHDTGALAGITKRRRATAKAVSRARVRPVPNCA